LIYFTIKNKQFISEIKISFVIYTNSNLYINASIDKLTISLKKKNI